MLVIMQAVSQNRFRQVVFSINASHDVMRVLYKFPYLDYEKSFKPSIGKQLHVDWAFFRRLSIGLSVNHQAHTLQVKDYSYLSNSVSVVEDVNQRISASSVALRVLIHPLQFYEEHDKKLDAYWGMQQYSSLVKIKDNSSDLSFTKSSSDFETFFGMIGGIRYYFTDQVGMNFEMTFPGPSTFALGLNLRSIGKDKFADPKKWWRKQLSE